MRLLKTLCKKIEYYTKKILSTIQKIQNTPIQKKLIDNNKYINNKINNKYELKRNI